MSNQMNLLLTVFAAIAFHRANPSDTDKIIILDCFVSFKRVPRMRCRRKSAGAANSSVMSKNCPSDGSCGGGNIRVMIVN